MAAGPIAFTVFALLYAYAYSESGRALYLALCAVSAACGAAILLSPKPCIQTDEGGISHLFGKRVRTHYQWGEIRQVVSRLSASNDYFTSVQGDSRSIAVSKCYQDSVELIRELREKAVNATFDDLTTRIAVSGYPRASTLRLLLLVLGTAVGVVAIMEILRRIA